MSELPHDSMLDLERIIRKAKLIDQIESRCLDTYDADEDEITIIQDEITDIRARIRELDTLNP
jgi:TolB-like protein